MDASVSDAQATLASPRRAGLSVVYTITPIVALCSLLYELLIAHTLATLAANTVVWYSLTIGTYIGAMGIGALWYQDFSSRDRGWTLLYQVELSLCLTGAAAVTVVHLAHTLHLYLAMHQAGGAAVAVFFGASLFVVSLVGVLTGIELPLLIQLGNQASSERPVANRVLGLDYIGSLGAGILFPLALVRHFELFSIGFATAAVNWAVAAWILLRVAGSDATRRRVAGASVVGITLVFAWVNSDHIEQYFLKRYYYYFENSAKLSTLLGSLAHRPPVVRESSPYQKIDLVHDSENSLTDLLMPAYSTKFALEPDHPRDRYLFLNGDFQVASNSEEVYHEYFAHVPVLAHGRVPENVLVLGAGDGLLISELLKYPDIRHITHVDLDPRLIELARVDPVLTAMNSHALDDSRVDTQLGDAFHYVRTTPATFDAIYMDFPSPKDYNLAKLYSREFFHFVGQRLAPDGYIALDAVGIDDLIHEPGVRNEEWDAYYHSVLAAGFRSVVPYISTLEDHNEAAYGIMETEIGWSRDVPADRARMDDALVRYVASLQQGFMMAKREPGWQPNREYWDLGIRLHVINEERFGLAFPELRLAMLDARKINSIMRPTLPVLGISHIRTAW